MKKNLVVMALLTVLLCVCLGGCGGEKSYKVESTPESSKSGSGEQTLKTDSYTVRYSENTKKSVSLPEGYPKNQFPIYKDSFIATVQDDGTGFIVTCFSKDTVDKVTAYYKEVLQNARMISVTDDDKGYVSFGVKDGYTYTVTIVASSEIEGHSTSYIITLLPAEEGMAESLKEMPGLGGGNP